ncbi:MAG: hypothetical protein ACI9EF_001971 [Pseudohongiellaceae bacterium]|jgi:hypothetical protein
MSKLILPSIFALAALSSSLFAQTAPVAFDDAYTTTQGDNLSVDDPGVLSNDEDADGDNLTAVLVDASGTVGNLLLLSDGSLEYETNGFVGAESFTYVANDGTANSNEATITFTVSGGSDLTTYTNHALFLAALADLGYSPLFEGFEDDAVWGAARTPATLPSVTNQGLTWESPSGSSEVTTGSGPAFQGQYGFYALPHGDYGAGPQCNQPCVCTDRWRISSDTPLVAFGGWVRTLGNGGKVALYLDGDYTNPIEPYNGHIFSWVYIGVVVPAGFQTIEIREVEGVSQDAYLIFADAFTFARETNGPWTDLGSGLVGTNGVPSLIGEGTLLAGDPLSVTLNSALENSTAWLAMGLSTINASFKGGVLVPDLGVPPCPCRSTPRALWQSRQPGRRGFPGALRSTPRCGS